MLKLLNRERKALTGASQRIKKAFSKENAFFIWMRQIVENAIHQDSVYLFLNIIQNLCRGLVL